jgi:hypothetical protein
MESDSGMTDKGKPKISEKNLSSATSPTTWTEPGVNPSLHGERPAIV